MRLQMLERRWCSKSAEQSCVKGEKSNVEMLSLPDRLLGHLLYTTFLFSKNPSSKISIPKSSSLD